MSKTIEARTYEEALAWVRDHGFDVTDAPGTNARVFLRKYNVSAAIQKAPDDGVKIFAYPGYLIGSEISKLINRGYQQFLKTSKTEIPATAITSTITASASGFANGTGNLSLYPSGLGFDTASFSVTTQATPTSLTIGMNMLTPNTLTFAGQGFLGPQAAASRTPSLAGRPPPAQLPAAQLQSC